MKMPGSVGTKKAKAVEQLLEELGVGENIQDTFNAVFRFSFLFRRSQYPVDSMVFNALVRLRLARFPAVLGVRFKERGLTKRLEIEPTHWGFWFPCRVLKEHSHGFAQIEKMSLNFSNSSFVIRVNLLHPKPSFVPVWFIFMSFGFFSIIKLLF